MLYASIKTGIWNSDWAGIQIFYDEDLAKQDDPILLETIKFTINNEKGLKFVALFAKDNFDKESLKSYTLNALKKINRREEHKHWTKKNLSESLQEKIVELIKQNFLDEYDGELIESVLNDLKIEIKPKHTDLIPMALSQSQFREPKNSDYSNRILPIALDPTSESDFKRRLLLTKTAYITTFYKNGTSKQKVWNANRFIESSGILGNLRSRPEFRNGEWHKPGFEKVYVSIDKSENETEFTKAPAGAHLEKVHPTEVCKTLGVKIWRAGNLEFLMHYINNPCVFVKKIIQLMMCSQSF